MLTYRLLVLFLFVFVFVTFILFSFERQNYREKSQREMFYLLVHPPWLTELGWAGLTPGARTPFRSPVWV